MKLLSITIVLFFLLSGCRANEEEVIRPVKYWNLPGGSHIAYIEIAAKDSTQSTPLIFLHGGPGAYQVTSFEIGRMWFEHLAELGFDVYIYDQTGSGLSARLDNPANYSVKRHMSDLEEIRKMIGSEKIFLVGDSWGATLAANYMANYPGKVIKACFTSPGPVDFDKWNRKSSTPRLAPEFLQWITDKYGEEKYTHYLKLDSLLQNNINSAYSYSGDKEMDELADSFLNDIVLETTVYDRQKLAATGMKFYGAGWWVMNMTVWDATNNKEPAVPKLKNDKTPVLILRGDSDYLPDEIAAEYHAAFPNSILIRIPLCGHLVWLEKPENYTREIESFLTNY